MSQRGDDSGTAEWRLRQKQADTGPNDKVILIINTSNLWQGKDRVATYTATFKQYASRTGYSDADLRDRFYDHLSKRIKDGLVNSQANTDLMQALISEAIHIDNRQNERADEEGKQYTRNTLKFSSYTPTPFVPAHDPNTMDVDVTTTGRSAEDYRRSMMGRCYGCGSREHRKADGHHEWDVCNHCGLTGHVAAICRRKFLGLPRPPPRSAAATSTVADPSTSIAATMPAPAADFTKILQMLTAGQKELAEQMAELRSNF
ncbi:hypothetical protein J3R30DRAFT_3790669 [Lentinula aciculospora]|uniref:CCHC-type domain-containing protein n=1 Tax=Lentinula aciculospora TaxID=153920 RepID=A0A9W9DV84_9AGAR|nr:hypothetical protein J3R30DRAFT_3790669 [Lentinula aciculospora]